MRSFLRVPKGQVTSRSSYENVSCMLGMHPSAQVIRLTVDQRLDTSGLAPPPTADDEANGALVPPLDLVIRTKWPGATVDWNGTDPIL